MSPFQGRCCEAVISIAVVCAIIITLVRFVLSDEV